MILIVVKDQHVEEVKGALHDNPVVQRSEACFSLSLTAKTAAKLNIAVDLLYCKHLF